MQKIMFFFVYYVLGVCMVLLTYVNHMLYRSVSEVLYLVWGGGGVDEGVDSIHPILIV